MGSTIIHKNIYTKVLLRASKLLFSTSAAANVQNPSLFLGALPTNVAPFNPFVVFNDPSRSKPYTYKNAKIIHAHLLRSTALHSDIFLTNSLLDWYCKSSAMADARRLFDQMPDPDLISWNIMVSGYTQNFLYEDSWRSFCRMRSLGFVPSQFTYGSVLAACAGLQHLIFAKLVYSLALKNGLFSNGYVRAGMIDLLAKNCSFEDALRVFRDVSCDNVVCWNAVISGAVKNGENWVALELFHEMCLITVMPNSFTISSILTACAALEDIEIGRGVQARVIKCGAEEDVFVGTAIVDFYAKCRKMDEAIKEFSCMPIRNLVSWTAIISGFVLKDDSASALHFFGEMRKMEEEVNSYTVTSVLASCAKPAMGREGPQLHSWTLKTGFFLDPIIGASLINMYSKIGAIDSSVKVFEEMKSLADISSWAVMISAYAQNESPGKAIELFQNMIQDGLKPDHFCSSSILSTIECLFLGRQIHSYNIKTGFIFDASVGSSLLTFYSKCGYLEESYEVFKQIQNKDNVSWSSMISGLAEHGYADQAIHLFREMQYEETRPDQMTVSALLTACSALRSFHMGREIHAQAVRSGSCNDLLVGSALVNMYSKCGASKLARSVFDMLPVKDQVSSSSLVSGYAQKGDIEEAFLAFHEMLMADLWIDSFVASSIIGAVAIHNRSEIGIQLHARVTKLGLDSEASVGSSLVMMYSKCGSIDDCCLVFDQIENPDLVSWTAMIASYAQHGKGAHALKLYELMRKEGINPDSITFVAVLSACSHSGLVEEGYFHLHSMAREYGIEAANRHYACMVDLLGRSGRLNEAERFINSMPIQPDALVWGTLLAACKVHGNAELGRLAAEKVIQLEPSDAGARISLSNICADVGQWEEVFEIRNQMKGTRAVKEPGWSLV